MPVVTVSSRAVLNPGAAKSARQGSNVIVVPPIAGRYPKAGRIVQARPRTIGTPRTSSVKAGANRRSIIPASL
jgi:hypothetical protein